jgi:DNA-binding NtrC family response regulator
MPFEHQRILNQVAEHRGFSRLGENVVRRATCKFVVADLLTPDAATDSGRLLPDVRDRLVGGVIVPPPLRDRINDIPALVEHFRQQANQTYQKRVVFDAEVAKTFMRGAWPGNVRMLQKIVHRIVLTCEGSVEWEQVLRCFDGYRETLEREMRPPLSRAAQGRTVSASRALPSDAQELLVLLSTEIEVQDPWSWRALVSKDAGDAEERRLSELVRDALKQDAQPLLEQLKLKLRGRGNTPRPLYHYQVLLYLAIHPKHKIDRARIGSITGLDSDQMRGDIGTNICLQSTNEGGNSDTDGPSWLVSFSKEGKKLIYRLNPLLLP